MNEYNDRYGPPRNRPEPPEYGVGDDPNRDLAQQRFNMGKDPGGSSSGGGGGGCFPRGTKIDTPKGKQDITNIKKGDYVLSLDTVKRETYPRKVLKIKSHANNNIWSIRFEDGSYIKTTSVHSFNIEGKWKKASNIKPGDMLSSFDSSKGAIERIVELSTTTDEVEEVYNLIVQGNYNFIADGAIAHSFTYFKTIRALGWALRSSISDARKERVFVHATKNA